MNISELMGGQFLTKEQFDKPRLLTIAQAGVQELNGESKLAVYFDEIEGGLVCNKSNLKAIGEILGKETEKWLGKQIVVFNDPSVTYKGERVGGLRVRAPKGKPAPDPELNDEVPF